MDFASLPILSLSESQGLVTTGNLRSTVNPVGIAFSQQRTFLQLATALRPLVGVDSNLPAKIQHLLSQDKRFGSRDRRLYRELIYTALRYWPWIEPKLDQDPTFAAICTAWLAADIPATRTYRAAWLSNWPLLPSTIQERATHLGEHTLPLPHWVAAECPPILQSPQLEALFSRAVICVRLQSPEAYSTVETEFSQRNWTFQRSATLENTWSVTADVDLTQSDSYRAGLIEIQDLGSQMILASIAISPGGKWLDACAGAGGKTLQLARILGPSGKVIAHDIRKDALIELNQRARRAGLGNITITSTIPTDRSFDGVLVDAPCTGSGTWRRSPHLKWTTSGDDIRAAAARQLDILSNYGKYVRNGGSLIYATCSFNHSENEDVISRFLVDHPEFTPQQANNRFNIPETSTAPGLAILPALHNTDAFYCCHLRRMA